MNPRLLLACLLCLFAAACGGGGDDPVPGSPGAGAGGGGGSGGGVNPPPGGGVTPPAGGGGPVLPSSRFDLANRCFALQSSSGSKFVVRSGAGYAATADGIEPAERFYMKPTALGEYLFHAKDGSLLSGSGTAVSAATVASPATNWIVEALAMGGFSARPETATNALATNEGGTLVLAATPGAFTFVPAEGCSAYPEISTDTVGNTYKGRGVGQPVVGFAEVHTHMAMGHEMSDGKSPVGPSAGGALYGQMFHRFGVPHALEDCAEWHGTDGMQDPEAIVLDMNPGATHDTQGWPTFIDWPARDSQLHQAMYYKWVERAWKAGLRILVSEGTNIEALCDVAKIYLTTIRPDAQTFECRDMELGLSQVRYLFQLQDYVDAQEGGPGKGWFRIVKSPAEARAVINEGKLAVIPGLEFSNIFHCTVTFLPGGLGEMSGCTEADIDREIQQAWDLGVREVFPYHDVNSSLGGTGIFDGLALNLVGFYGTRGFWQVEDCPNGGEGETYFYSAGALMYNSGAPSGFGSDPLTSALIAATQGTLPTYKTGVRQCNRRGMTPLGEYAMRRIMQRGFIIDIDHASLKAKQKMLDMANATDPPYPLVSAHGGHGGITVDQARNILRNRGLIYPFHDNGRAHTAFVQKLAPLWNAERAAEPIAVGFGADANGIANRAVQRGGTATPVTYPFTLFQGSEWNDPMFAGFAPVVFNLQTVPESGKTWDVNEVASGAHYGMIADFVEEVRIEGGKPALKALYQSAEAYLQMWERVEQASAGVP